MTSFINLSYFVLLLSMLAAGIIAGMMLSIAIANYAARGLPEESWTLRFQLENKLFTKTMPFFLLAPLVGLGAAIFLTGGGTRQIFVAAAVMTLIVLLITIFLEVPINDQVGSWSAGAAPVEWTEVRDRWLWYHLIRTITGIIAFVCAAIGFSHL